MVHPSFSSSGLLLQQATSHESHGKGSPHCRPFTGWKRILGWAPIHLPPPDSLHLLESTLLNLTPEPTCPSLPLLWTRPTEGGRWSKLQCGQNTGCLQKSCQSSWKCGVKRHISFGAESLQSVRRYCPNHTQCGLCKGSLYEGMQSCCAPAAAAFLERGVNTQFQCRPTPGPQPAGVCVWAADTGHFPTLAQSAASVIQTSSTLRNEISLLQNENAEPCQTVLVHSRRERKSLKSSATLSQR